MEVNFKTITLAPPARCRVNDSAVVLLLNWDIVCVVEAFKYPTLTRCVFGVLQPFELSYLRKLRQSENAHKLIFSN